MARMPAKGPSPTTLIQISAQISVSTLRMVSRKRRVTKRKTQPGMTLRAARKPNGRASGAASSVPRNAMARVSASDQR